MKRLLMSLSLATVVCAATATTATAGGTDWNGIKEYQAVPAGVPVPAPIPVPDYAAEWFVKIDIGGTVLNDATTSSSSAEAVVRDADDFDPELTLNFEVGRYLTRNLRASLSADFRTHGNVTYPGEAVYFTNVLFSNSGIVDPITGAPSIDTVTYEVTRADVTVMDHNNFMANLYYDLPMSRAFKPYVGAGIGMTYQRMKRNAELSAVCDSVNNSVAGAQGCGSYASESASIADEVQAFQLTGALMAGFSYEVKPGIHWDNGYRMTYSNGEIASAFIMATGIDNTVAVENLMQHELRTGLRFDID